jgi:tetratricopeptide (TPR) repeat protein
VAKTGDKQCAALLGGLGFKGEGRQTWTHWKWTSPQDKGPLPRGAGSNRLVMPWSIESFELAERKGGLAVHRIDACLDRGALRSNLGILTKRYFGVRTTSEIVEGRDGELWCLFEFQRPGSRDRDASNETVREDASPFGQLPYGIGGFCVRFAADGLSMSVIVSGFFGIGYLPGDFPQLPLRYVRDALGLRQPEAVAFEFHAASVYEWTLPVYLPVLALLAKGANHNAVVALGAQLGVAKPMADTVLIREADALRVVAPADERALAARDLPMEKASLCRVPVEVLEARERVARYREIDLSILAGKASRALELLSSALQSAPDSLYLMRRFALLGLCARRERLPSFVEAALAAEPDHELFLSYATALALDANDPRITLERLSRLGARLTRQIPGADQIGTFDVVLPELLGDAWLAEDPSKAEDCYHRIIERRGDLPRLLRKLIHVARTTRRPEVEVGLLNRLSRVERRKVEVAKIHLRHAELRRAHATGRDEALELALKALRLDRSEGRAAVLASELLVEKGKPEEAIQLLDGLLKDGAVALPQKTRARLYAELARVWERHLGRPDLAETRYEQAIEHDSGDVAVLKSLEAIYRQRRDIEKLAWLLEIQFDAFEALLLGDQMRATFEELAALYRGVLGRPSRAYELYQRLLANVATSPEEIDRILAWRDVDIDWRDLYNRLVLKLPSLPRGEHRAQYLCRLAELCRERLDDAPAAQRHLLSALEDGFVDTFGFRFLVETLGAAGDYAQLASCYELRVEQVGPAQRRELLLEMLQIPQALTDARRDQIALAAYLLDPSQQGVIHQRFRRYQQLDDIDGLRKLVALILSEKGVPALSRSLWMRAAVEAAAAFEAESRFALMDELFRKLLDAGEEEKATLSDAINALRDSKDAGRLLYFVTRLLKNGVLPPLNERAVLRLLSGHDLELALYHQLMSLGSTKPEIAAVHARTAAALYAKRDKQEVNTEAMLARLCTLVPCAEDDLAQLTQLVSVTGNYAAMARALQKQADFEDEKGRKFRLLDQLAQTYWKKMKDHGRARLTYVLAIKLAPEPTRIKLLLAQIAGDAGDVKAERKALADFLLDPQCVNDTLAMTAAVGRLVRLGEDRRIVQRLVTPHVEHAMQIGQSELAGRVAQTLIDNDAASTDVFRIAFRAAVAVRNDRRAKLCWWNGLASVSDKARAKAFMAETRQLLDREGRKDLLIDCYQEALEHRIGDRLGPKIKREILIQYGALLFDSDARRDRALSIYVEAYRGDPEDNRTWMPLYFLLLEFGSPVERLRHLTEIISKLEQDPRPLKAFPITIESLQAELRELEAQLKEGVLSKAAEGDADGGGNALPALPNDVQAGVSPQLAADADMHERFGVESAGETALPAVAGEMPGFGAPQARLSVGGGLSAAPSTSLRLAIPPPPPPPPPSGAIRGRYFTVVDGKVEPDADDSGMRSTQESERSGAASGLGAYEAQAAFPGPHGFGLGVADFGEQPPTQERIVVPGAMREVEAAASGLSIDLGVLPVPGEAAAVPALAGSGFALDFALDGEVAASGGLEQGSKAGGAVDEGAAQVSLRLEMPAPAPAYGAALMAPVDFLPTIDLPSPTDPAPPGGVLPQSESRPPVLGSFAIDEASAVLDIGLAGALSASAPAPAPASQAAPSLGAGGLLDMAEFTDGPVSSVELAMVIEAPGEERSLGREPLGVSPALAEPALATPAPVTPAPALLAGQPVPDGESERTSVIPPVEVRGASKAPAEPSGFSRSMQSSVQAEDTSQQAESGDSGINNRAAGLFAGIEGGQDDVSDWRAAVNKGDFNSDLTSRLVTQAFASEIEKHLAIQAVALVAGNCDQLNSWHWRVWRKPDEYGYRISATERFPEELRAPVLDSSLMKLVTAMGAILAKAYRERFTLEHIAKRLEMQVPALEKLRKPMDWNGGLLKEIGMPLLANRINSKAFRAYNLAGLEHEIFYEGAARSFYIDETYFRRVPPSHLFHRLSGMMWAVHARYFVPLALHPHKQFLPVMQEVHQNFGSHGLSRLRSRLTGKTRLAKIFATADTREIRSLYEKTGMPTEEQIGQLWDAMRMHLHRVQIAETLDIVGVFESILDKDLLKSGVVRHSEIYELSPMSKPLIEFVTKLNI